MYVPTQKPELGRALVIDSARKYGKWRMVKTLEEVALGSESRKPNDESGKPADADFEEEAS